MTLYSQIMAQERASIYRPTGKVCSELSATPHIPWARVDRHPLPAIPKNEEKAMPQMRRTFNYGQMASAIKYLETQPMDKLFTASEIEALGYYQGICTRLVDRGVIEIAIPKRIGNAIPKYRRVK